MSMKIRKESESVLRERTVIINADGTVQSIKEVKSFYRYEEETFVPFVTQVRVIEEEVK